MKTKSCPSPQRGVSSIDYAKPETDLKQLVVGRIPYLVCAPYFYHSLQGLNYARFVDDVPARLNTLLEQGAIDCAPSSSIEYARNYEDYYLVRNFSTGGHGKIRSVLLLSHVPWEALNGRSVALSPSSSTSNLLFQLLCRRRYNVDPILNMADEPAACLAIGDEALRMSYHGSWKYSYDLAEEWYKWQSLPFTFGIWIVRKQAYEEKQKQILDFIDHLEASCKAFFEKLPGSIKNWVNVYPTRLPQRLMEAFFENSDYTLSPLHEKSLRLFFNMAEDMGFIKRCPGLEFLPAP